MSQRFNSPRSGTQGRAQVPVIATIASLLILILLGGMIWLSQREPAKAPQSSSHEKPLITESAPEAAEPGTAKPGAPVATELAKTEAAPAAPTDAPPATDAQASTPEVPGGDVHIAGKILDENKAPIADALVQWFSAEDRRAVQLLQDPAIGDGASLGDLLPASLRGQLGKRASASSKADGSYELTVSKGGVLIVSKSGFGTEVRSLSAGANVDIDELPEGNDGIKRLIETQLKGPASYDFVLVAGGKLSGVVLDASSRTPAAGMVVVARKRSREGSSLMVEIGLNAADTSPKAIVHEDGAYAFSGLPGGDYVVFPRAGRSEYPSLSSQNGRKVTVQPGQDASGIDFLVSPGGVITGVVRDSSGAPVAGATVKVMPKDIMSVVMSGNMESFTSLEEQSRQSDAAGEFRYPALSLGFDYRVNASHENYSVCHSDPVTLSETNKSAHLELTMLEGGSIAGYVINEAGERVPSTSVTAAPDFSKILSEGLLDFDMSQNHAMSDENGEFKIDHLAPGKYTLRTGSSIRGVVNPMTAAADADAIDLPEGAHLTGIAVAFKSPDDADEDVGETAEQTFDGQVVDDAGTPVSGATVSIAAGRFGAFNKQSVSTDERGNFTATVNARGPFRLSAEKAGYHGGDTASFDKGRLGVTLTVERRAAIRGKVLSQSGEPVAGCEVSSAELDAGNPYTDMMLLGNSETSVRTGADGGFFLEGVSPGKLELVAHASGFAPARTEPLEVAPGAQLEAVTIRLTIGGTLHGKITATERGALAGASVQLVRSGGNMMDEMLARMMPGLAAGSDLSATSGDEGLFEMSHLAHGNYKVLVQHPDFAPAAAIDIEIKNDGDVNVGTIKLQPGATLNVHLFDRSSQQPRGGVMLQLVGADAPLQMGSTSADGYYTFKNVPPGDYVVMVNDMSEAEEGSFQSKAHNVEVTGPGTIAVEIAQGGGVKIFGEVQGLAEGKMQQISLRRPGGTAPEHIDFSNMNELFASAKYTAAQSIVLENKYELTGIEPGTYFLEMIPTPDDQSDLEAYKTMDLTPLYREQIEVKELDIERNITVRER